VVIKKVRDDWYQVSIRSKKKTYTAFAFTVTQAKAKAKELLRKAWNEHSEKTESKTSEPETNDGRGNVVGIHEGDSEGSETDAALRARLRANRGRAPWHRRQ